MKVSPNRQASARTKNLGKQKQTLEESRWKELEKRREKQANLQSKGIVTNVAGQKLSSFSSVRKLSAGPVIS
ncbi:putative cilia- and flagella-associated protein 99 [Apostichopus japonicus]|uniref:Putative cilia-and flagella-associated protein 99 n=1 Tax=Stichopus japonicus TaxID=307972 RepID=A0A2G8KSP8_STIJA|nr:putative cilia- and flagella-associated protein 99 [Apostichopus japonicus]